MGTFPARGEPLFALTQMLHMCFEQDHEPYDTVDGAVAQWCVDMHDEVLLELQEDIERFRAEVPDVDKRRAAFRFHLPFDPDGRDFDALLVSAVAHIGDLLRQRDASGPDM